MTLLWLLLAILAVEHEIMRYGHGPHRDEFTEAWSVLQRDVQAFSAGQIHG